MQNALCKNEGRGILRRGRKKSSTGFYHIVVKGIAQERNFNQAREKTYFKLIIKKYLQKYQVKIYAYCIMSNHAHIMIWAEIQELSLFMARILAEYANYYNYKHGRNAHVVNKAAAYKYSSIKEYFSSEKVLLHEDAVNLIRSRFDEFKIFEAFHQGRKDEVSEDIRGEIEQQRIEAAEMIARELCEKNNFDLCVQVFEEKVVREEYIKKFSGY